MASDFVLDGRTPKTVFTPRDADELARLLAQCNRERCVVVPWGGGTLQHIGNPPTRLDAVMQTTALDQVVDYAYDDLTITVQAGMTLHALGNVLAEHNQFLPIDVPFPETATIGGVLAAGANGPLRLRYGPVRDYMIGNRFATVDGEIIKAGSKVVKNVAGYELHKVMVGALGTLGILTEATFKIFPKPPSETTVWASFAELSDACLAIPKIWNLPTPPHAIELFDAATAAELELALSGAWHLAVRFGGSQAAMAAARDSSTQAAHEQNAVHVETDADAATFWRAYADLPATTRQAHPDATLVRVSLPPQALQLALKRIVDLVHVQHLSLPRVFGHGASAIVYVSLDGDASAILALLAPLRAQLHALQGHTVVEHAPGDLKHKLGAWDEPGASFRLMRALKQKFDPNNILNPGRFVGGL